MSRLKADNCGAPATGRQVMHPRSKSILMNTELLKGAMSGILSPPHGDIGTGRDLVTTARLAKT